MKIKNFKEYRKGLMIGFFDLEVEEVGFELYGCSLWLKGNQRWVNLPAKEYTNSEGEKKYAPIFKMVDEDRHNQFKKVALECALAYCETNGIRL